MSLTCEKDQDANKQQICRSTELQSYKISDRWQRIIISNVISVQRVTSVPRRGCDYIISTFTQWGHHRSQTPRIRITNAPCLKAKLLWIPIRTIHWTNSSNVLRFTDDPVTPPISRGIRHQSSQSHFARVCERKFSQKQSLKRFLLNSNTLKITFFRSQPTIISIDWLKKQRHIKKIITSSVNWTSKRCRTHNW